MARGWGKFWYLGARTKARDGAAPSESVDFFGAWANSIADALGVNNQLMPTYLLST
jgi:hypothetical protein